MCWPTISCRVGYFNLANTGQLLMRCITVSLDSPHNLHISDTSWPSIWYFIEFTRSACSCATHTIASVSFLRCPSFNHCHVFSALTLSVSFRNLLWSGFSSHCLVSSSFKRFLNASGSSTSNNAFSPATYFNIHSLLSLRYLSRLCTSTFTHSSQLISLLPSSSLPRYNLPIFLLRCRLPFMVINFLVLISILFNYTFVQCNTPSLYLITFPPFICVT